MKLKLLILALSLVALLRIESPQAATDNTLVIPVAAQGLTAMIGFGLDDRDGPLGIQQFGTVTTYTTALYRIQLTNSPGARRNILRVRVEALSREAFQLQGLSIRVRVPRSSIQGIWYPSSDVSSTNVMSSGSRQSFRDFAEANYGIPYVAAASADSRNVFAMGLGRQDLSVSVEGEPIDSGNFEFRLRITSPRTALVFDERFFISSDTSMTWFETAAAYADWVDQVTGYRPFPTSEKAYEPVYDTWYWSADRVDDRLYLETAKLASEAGAGLFLADSGWDAPTGEYDRWLDGATGNYSPPPDKFPDLARTFDAIRSEYKLGIHLWLQPFAVGRQSQRYAATRNLHIQLPANPSGMPGWNGITTAPFALPLGQNLETVNLCPRVPGTQAYLRNLFTEMAAKYRPEGYWLDFMDGIATNCVASHTHRYQTFGEGFRHTLETIKSTILAANPNAVVHYRARYANLNTKPYANVWQSEDSPGDFDRMRMNAIRLRPFSKGVTFASDQLYWPAGTDEITVSKYIMTSVMTGVPAFGPDLTNMAPHDMAKLKSWLSFYREHKLDLATGRFSPFGQLEVPNHKIEGKDKTFAYVRNLDFFELRATGRTVFVMNATDADHFSGRIAGDAGVRAYSVKVLDRFLNAENGEIGVRTDASSAVHLNVAVQQGGMLVLTAQDSAGPLPLNFSGEEVTNEGPDISDPVSYVERWIIRALLPFMLYGF